MWAISTFNPTISFAQNVIRVIFVQNPSPRLLFKWTPKKSNKTINKLACEKEQMERTKHDS